MSTTIIAGPFTREEAEDTAKYLGAASHSVVAFHRTDAEGYTLDECNYYVERDSAALPSTFCGLSWDQIQAKQRGKRS